MAKKTVKRHLVLEVVEKAGKRFLRVKSQTHRNDDFAADILRVVETIE